MKVAALESQLARQAPVIAAARAQCVAWDQHSRVAWDQHRRNEVNDWMTKTGRTEDAIRKLDKETL